MNQTQIEKMMRDAYKRAEEIRAGKRQQVTVMSQKDQDAYGAMYSNEKMVKGF